jgi:hypothetical protein
LNQKSRLCLTEARFLIQTACVFNSHNCLSYLIQTGMLHSSQIALGDINAKHQSNMSTDAQRLAELAKLFAFTMDDG